MVTAALLVAMTVTAMEQLVVSPAMPTIIAQLKGFEIYPWVISAYLLAATVSTPIYGKLADLYGRKRVLLFGLVLFSLGSILSGTSQSMGQLIAMRTIQGLGAGAVGPIVLTMLGDLFTLQERAQRSGALQRRLGLVERRRPDPRRLSDRLRRLALGLPRQRAVRPRRDRHADLVRDRAEGRSQGRADRLGRRRAALTAGLTSLLWLVLDGSQHGIAMATGLLAASVASPGPVRAPRASGRPTRSCRWT